MTVPRTPGPFDAGPGDAEPGGADERTLELARNLAALRQRVAQASAAAGRDPAPITLIAVTKTWPAQDVRRLASLGVLDVGENRDQEASPKAEQCAGWGLTLRWHLVGQLQRNKARSVARYADVVHSVDRLPLVEALDEAAAGAGRLLTALVQVSLDGTPGRGGAHPDDVLRLADAIAARTSLRLGGVMAVAPRDADPRQAFDRLVALSADVVREHPEAGMVSAGMSGDLEAAVAAGATHLRVGAALLGQRPPLG